MALDSMLSLISEKVSTTFERSFWIHSDLVVLFELSSISYIITLNFLSAVLYSEVGSS